MMEIKKRELEARIYFAMKSAINGFSTCIGTKSSIMTYSKYFKKGAVILKSIGPDNHKMIDRMNNLGHFTCAWDEEGMTFFEDEYNDRRLDINNLKKLKLFFTWGDIDTNIINRYYPDQKFKIHKTGNSRIDVLRSPYNEIYDYEARKIKEKHGNFILFPTLFTQCNAANMYRSDYVTGLLRSGFKPNSPCVVIGKNLTIQQNNILEHTKNFFKTFSDKCPDKKLIVRPHPSEKIDYWFDLVDKFKNIEVVFDDQSTCSWIAASELLISTNCTTAIEAYYLNKKSVNFLPFRDETVEYKLPKAVSKVVTSIEDLIDIIQNIKNKDLFGSKEKNETIIKEWLLNGIDGCSVENTIKIIDNQMEGIKSDKDKFSDKFSQMILSFTRYLRIRYNFLTASKQTKYNIRLQRQKFPNLALKEVKEKVSYFSQFMNNQKFEVKEIYPKLFSIEKK